VLDTTGADGPRLSRLSPKLLFSDFEFCVIPPLSDITKQQLEVGFHHVKVIFLRNCTVGHKSHDPCFHVFLMEAGVMTFVVFCTWCRTSITNLFFFLFFSGTC